MPLNDFFNLFQNEMQIFQKKKNKFFIHKTVKNKMYKISFLVDKI